MRHDRLDVEETTERNPLQDWHRFRHPVRVTWNTVLLSIAKYLPIGLKNRVLQLTGVDIGDHVSVALGAMFDIFHPDKISIGDNTTIGYNTVILTHEATQDEFRTGPVEIGDDVLIGANCTVLPGVEIGDGATVAAHSLVNTDVPADTFVGGVPAEPIERDN